MGMTIERADDHNRTQFRNLKVGDCFIDEGFAEDAILMKTVLSSQGDAVILTGAGAGSIMGIQNGILVRVINPVLRIKGE